jgi:hypothetical protein
MRQEHLACPVVRLARLRSPRLELKREPGSPTDPWASEPFLCPSGGLPGPSSGFRMVRPAPVTHGVQLGGRSESRFRPDPHFEHGLVLRPGAPEYQVGGKRIPVPGSPPGFREVVRVVDRAFRPSRNENGIGSKTSPQATAEVQSRTTAEDDQRATSLATTTSRPQAELRRARGVR